MAVASGISKTCSYFVDEAGDSTLFDAKGRVIVGSSGCSRYFILGLAEIRDPANWERESRELRDQLLADPYFAGVPSMQPEGRKTAVAFHAKDDLPEVRWKVFQLLLRHDIRFFAVVRHKREVLQYVRRRNEADAAYRYHPNELYDYMVRRLFRDRLHKNDQYDIFFAKRGFSDRTRALFDALHAARQQCFKRWGIASAAPIRVIPADLASCPGLEATDYFLWAVQRLYERREERYIRLLWPLVSLVHDIDDRREVDYGVYYNHKRPLTLAAIEGILGI